MKPTLVEQLNSSRAHAKRVDTSDERVHVNLHQLVCLQHQARDFSFLPTQPVHSLLSGRHASRVRGRGLNFEEIRQYHSGDDIRTIDWKVTARLRKPHTRAFTEERDRPALLIVDQRIGMFYGTKLNMKSVTAAQVAALGAWRILDSGDRIGAIIFNDEEFEFIAPGRSRSTVMRILKQLTAFNQQLSADSPLRPNPQMFGRVIDHACRIARHDYLISVISDFHGLDDDSQKSLVRIRQHNDLIASLVHDPSASNLPHSRDYVVTDGDLQIEIQSKSRSAKRVQETSSGRIADVLELQYKLQSPVLPISTAEETALQLKKLLGFRVNS